MPTKVTQANLEVYQGDDYAATLLVLVDNSPNPATAFNLDDYTPRAQIRLGPADKPSPVILDITVAVTDAPNGEIRISLTHDQTASLINSRYLWDMELVSTTSGAVKTIVGGTINVSKEITRVEVAKA